MKSIKTIAINDASIVMLDSTTLYLFEKRFRH